MSFRFIFWGDSSQNESLTDFYAQQAEADFRNAHLSDFENLNELKLNVSQFVEPENSSNPKESGLNNLTNAVSGLIQTVTETKTTETTNSSPDASKINSTISDAITTVTNALPASNAAQTKHEADNIANTVAESIQSVSEAISAGNMQNTSVAANAALSTQGANSIDNSSSISALNQLIQKMKSFLEEFKNKCISLLEHIQKPQLQYYYGVEDTIKDTEKKLQYDLNKEKKQRFIEEKVSLKMAEAEKNLELQKKQLKLKEETREKAIESEKKAELDKILAKKLEEMRNRPVFNR
jgi:hypothetical protein